MIISNSATTTPVQSGEASKPNSTSPTDTTRTPVADVKPGTPGIKRLSSDAATVVLTEQGKDRTSPAPAKAPPPPPKLDLHGQDLRTADLTKLDLRGADLTGADFTGKNLSGIDLSGATLTGAKFDGATFSHTNLHGVTATGASFTKASFDETDLDNGNFTEAKFTGATFGANFQLPPTDVQTFEKCYIIKGVNLTKADFSGTNFTHEMFIDQFTADDASFAQASSSARVGLITFTKGSLKRANFEGIKAGLDIGGVDASNADFSHINGGGARFGVCNVDGATFHDSDTKLWFDRMDIRNADLSTKDKSLRKSSFVDCNMSGMDFSGYDFSGANFLSYGPTSEGLYGKASSIDTGELVTGTNFRGAKFTDAYFSNMQMTKSLIDSGGFQGATVTNNIGYVIHIENEKYDVAMLFRNIWPQYKRRLAEMGR
jgi:uncharacterized protein YjbI with pentapeptide repeats